MFSRVFGARSARVLRVFSVGFAPVLSCAARFFARFTCVRGATPQPHGALGSYVLLRPAFFATLITSLSVRALDDEWPDVAATESSGNRTISARPQAREASQPLGASRQHLQHHDNHARAVGGPESAAKASL